MPKPNDFFAANLNAPENFTFDDFYTHNITPDNTELHDSEYYKNIPQVKKEFTKDGKFDDATYNAYYNGVLRLYNDFSQLDYTQQVIDSIDRAPESIRNLDNTNIKDTSAILYSNPDPWRHSRGMQGIKTIGDPSFDIREVAQTNYMRDESGNKLDYKPNDLKFFKGLFAKPAVLAEDEYGNPLLDENGDPYYRELKKGEDLTGKTLLHWTDTFTEDDSALNKFDFFDRDGLDKSVGGTIVDTVFRIAPYFIPYVGQVIGGLQAISGLVAATPMLVKAVDGILENNPNSTITKKMNQLDAFMSRYDRSKSRKSMEKNWTFENLGDMIADSIMQLRQQKTFSYLPQIMGAFDKAKKLEKPSEAAIKWGRNASLAFMSLTSAEDSFNTFREAGVDSRTAGIMSLAYAASLFGLMNTDYFKEWLFKDSWLTTDPELAEVLKKANREASKTVLSTLKIGAETGKRVSLNTELPKDAAGLFKRVLNATKSAWKGKTIQPFKELEITAPGAFSTANLYLNRAINEGVEETMEEAVLDLGKGIVSALDALGINVSEDEKKKIDFGLTFDDIVTRYSTAFLGGAIGGAVFEGMNKYDKWIFNNNANAVVGKSANAQLVNAIREHGADNVKTILEKLYRKKNGLGNESLSWKGKYVSDPKNENAQIWKYEAGNPSENQNTLMYNIMKSRIEIFDGIMKDKNFNIDNNTLLARIAGNIAQKAEKAGMTVDDYIKETGNDPIMEYMKKTGAGDIILFDVTNLQTDIVDLQTKINAAKAEISQQFLGDTSDIKQHREDAIKNDSYIKNLEEQMKQKEKEYDALINGNSAAYYIRLANFASSNLLLDKMLGSEDESGNRNLPWTKEGFARLKYRVNYNSLSDSEKEQVDEDYKDFLQLSKSSDLDAIIKANDVYQATRDLVLRSLQGVNIQDILENSHALPALIQSQVVETESDAQVNRALSNKPEEDWYTKITDMINSGSTDRAINTLQQYIDQLVDNKIIALNFEDFKNYAYDKIINSLQEDLDSIKVGQILDNIRTALDNGSLSSADYTNSQIAQTEAQEKWNSVVDSYYNSHPELNADDDYYNKDGEAYDAKEREIQTWINEQNRANGLLEVDILSNLYANTKFINNNKLNYTEGRINFVNEVQNQLNNILNIFKSNPTEAIIKLNELQDYTKTNIPSEDIYNAVIEPFNYILNSLQALQNAISRSSEIKQSPVIYLLNALATEYQGGPIKLLDLLDKEQRHVHELKNVDDYVLNSYTASELALVQDLLPLVETILGGAMFGIDANTDQMLVDAGLETTIPPEISPNFLMHVAQEFQFIKNKIKFLVDLHNNNMNAKTKEQTLVRKNFFKNIYNKLVNPESVEGDYISKINALLNGKTLSDLWQEALNEVGENISPEFDSDNDEDQINIMKAFINFERKIYEQVKSKDPSQIGKAIANIFPDNWKCKNGILSRNEDDDLSNFDITSYLLAVIGSDPNVFYSKLKEKFGEDKFPFFGQELAIRLAYTGIVNPNIVNGALSGLKDQLDKALENPATNGLFNLKADGTTESLSNDDKNYLKSKPVISNTIFIDGFAGVGKSTMVLKTAIEIASKDNYEVFVSAKDSKRAKQLGKSISLEENSESIKTVDELLNDILGEDYDPKKYEEFKNNHIFALKQKNANFKFRNLFKTTKPRIIAIDEGTQLTEAQWEILGIAAKNSNVTIIGLGNTMQFGASNESGDTGNIDDCMIMLGTKLTVSMRDGNAGKSRNNLIVGTKVDEAVKLTKEYPATGNEIISKQITGKIVLDYGRDSELRICGDEIVPEINMELINKIIDTLHDDETIVVITENEPLKNQVLDKYGDDKRVSVRSKSDCAGDEFDYAIIDENIDSDPNTKYVELKNFYTYITRARKGSIIKNSEGLSNNLEISCKLSPTASSTIASVVGTDAAQRYKDLRQKSLEGIEATLESTESEAPIRNTSESIDDDAKEFLKPRELENSEEIQSKIINENSTEGEPSNKDNNSPEDLEDTLTLGSPKKGNSARAWEKRKAIIGDPNGHYIDYNDLAEQLDRLQTIDDSSISLNSLIAKWLGIDTNSKFTTGLKISDNNATDEKTLNIYKQFVNIFASALLNTKYDSIEDLNSWRETIKQKIDERISFLTNNLDSNFRSDFINAINNGNYRFIVKFSEDEKKNIYFTFTGKDKKYIIPLGKIKVETSGVFKQLIINNKNTSDVVLMSSNGTHRDSIKTKGRADVLNLDNNPLTLILGNIDTLVTNDEKVKNFIRNKGKAFIPICREFGLSNREILELLKPETENGTVSYLYQQNIPISLAGIQKNISPDDFFNLIGAIQRRIQDGTHVNERGDVERADVELICRIFGLEAQEVVDDFIKIQSDDGEEDIESTYDRLKRLSDKYGILSNRGRDLVFSSLILNGLTNPTFSEKSETIRSAIIKYLNDNYESRTDASKKRFGVLKLIWNEFGARDLNLYIFQGVNGKIQLGFGEEFQILSTDDFIDTGIKNGDFLTSLSGINSSNNLYSIISDLLSKVRNPTGIAAEFLNKLEITPAGTDSKGNPTNSDVTPNKLKELFENKNRNLRISIATAVETIEKQTLYRFYAPYESQLHKFLTPEGSSEPVFTDTEIAAIVGSDPKYAYGIYTNIAAKKIQNADSDIWMRGTAPNNDCSWDIVDIYGAVYGLGPNVFEDSDTSDSDYSDFSNTKVNSNISEIKVEYPSNQEIAFSKNGMSSGINCDNELKSFLANSITDEDIKSLLNTGDVVIDKISTQDNNIVIELKINNSKYVVPLKSHKQLFNKLGINKNIIPGKIVGNFVFKYDSEGNILPNSIERIVNKDTLKTSKVRIGGLFQNRVSYIYDNGQVKVERIPETEFNELKALLPELQGIVYLGVDSDFLLYKKVDRNGNTTLVVHDNETNEETSYNPQELIARLDDLGIEFTTPEGKSYFITTDTANPNCISGTNYDVMRLFNMLDFIVGDNIYQVENNGEFIFDNGKPSISGRLLNIYNPETLWDDSIYYDIDSYNPTSGTFTVNGQVIHSNTFLTQFGSKFAEVKKREYTKNQLKAQLEGLSALSSEINSKWNETHNLQEVQEILDDAFIRDDTNGRLYKIVEENGNFKIIEDTSNEAGIIKAFANNENFGISSLNELSITRKDGKFLVTLDNGIIKKYYDVEVNGENVNISERFDNQPEVNQKELLRNKINNAPLNEYSKKYLKLLLNNNIEELFNMPIEEVSQVEIDNDLYTQLAKEIDDQQVKCTK